MIEYIVKNKEFFVIIISLLGIIGPLTSFLVTKSKEQQQLNFEKFHKDLMYGLSNRKAEIGLDQQVAILYELRNYPAYYPVIKRLLQFQIKRWKGELKTNPHFSQLINEANETLNFMSENFFKRFFYKNFR